MNSEIHRPTIGKLHAAGPRQAHRPTFRRGNGLRLVLAVALLLMALACPPGRAQTMETLTNSINGFEALLANVQPDQQAVYVGDMGFSPAYLRAWISQLQKMAGLSVTNTVAPHSAFSGDVASWPNGVVPYAYDSSMTSAMTNEFEGAIYIWQKVANLKFIQRTTEANFIIVTNDGYGSPSDSYVGMIGGPQLLRINTSFPQLDWVHELGHAMGMIHEQQRSDRDTYVKINWGNFTAASLASGYAAVNYGILTNSINIGNYDYDSIMEYPTVDGNVARTNGIPTACSDPSCSEITPLEPYYSAQGSPPLGQTTHLSTGDLAAMAGKYGTPRTISGHVYNGLNGPFAGVTVTISGGVSYRGPASVVTDSNGAFSFGAIPNNSGTFTITANLAGHTFTQGSWNVTIGTTDFTTANFNDADTSPPTVTIISPTNTSYKVAPPASGTAADNNGTADTGVAQVNVVMYRSADGVWWNFHDNTWGTTNFNAYYNLTVATGTTSWSAALPSSLADGGYQVQAQAVDNAANASGWVTRNFTIDNTAPAITFSPLTNQQVVFNFDQLGGTVSKPCTVKFSIEWFQAGGNQFWNGVNWTSVSSDPGVLLAANLSGLNWTPAPGTLPPRQQLAQANYVIHAAVTDPAGNTNYNNIVLTRSPLDTTPPVVTLDYILNGAVLTNQYLPGLSGSALDYESGVASVTVYLNRFSNGDILYWDGSSWNANPASLTATYNPQTVAWQVNSPLPSGATLPNAAYQVQVSAQNNESPAGSKLLSVSFSVDYHPVYVWTAGSFSDGDPYNNNNNWNNPANWDVLSVPADDGDVVINGGSPDATSLGSVPVHGLDLSNATLTIPGLLVTKLNVFPGGTLQGGAVTLRTNGIFNWTGGVLAGTFTVPASAVMNVSNVDQKILADYAVLNNGGTINWQGGGMMLGNGYNSSSFITNLPGAIFQSTADGPMLGHYNGNPLVFVNAGGIFAKVAGAGTNSVDNAHFINTGVVRCDSGVLAFNNQLDLNAGGTFTGSATNRVIGGTATVGGLTTISNGVLELDGGTFAGAGDGSGTFGTTGSGKLVWSGGVLNGTLTLAANAQAEISGPDVKTFADFAVLNNDGQLTWLNGAIWATGYNGPSYLRNRAGATFTVAGTNVASHANGNPGQFENQPGASLVVNTAGESWWNGWLLINDGVLSGLAGRLNLAQGGASTGTFTNVSGSEVSFTGGTFLLHGGTRFAGAGTTRIAGATLTADGLAMSEGSSFQLDSGVLNGTGFTSKGQFYWNGGVIGGTCSNALEGVFTMTGSNTMVLADSAVFNNKGTAQLLNSPLMANGYNDGATWNNLAGSLFNIASDGGVLGHFNGNLLIFNNLSGAGFAKTAGTNSVLDSGVLNNSGELGCDTGILSYATTINLNPGGTFTGAGQHVINGGTVTWLGTNMVQNSSLNFSGGAVVGISNATVVVASPSLFDWTGGILYGAMTLPSGSTLRLSGTGERVLGDNAVFNNAGTTLFTGTGRLLANGYNAGATWNNLAGSQFSLATDGSVLGHNNGNPFVFNNLAGGRFAKTAGTNSTVASTTLNNSGELGCDSGSLTFNTTLNLNPGGVFTGLGQHIIAGGVAGWFGTNTVQSSSLNFSSGTVVGLSNATIVAAGSSLLEWTGGTIAGIMTLQNGSSLRLSGTNDHVLADSASFNNAGTILFTGTGRLMANGYNDVATWNNLAGAHFNFATDGSVLGHFNGNPLVFNNFAGARLAKTVGTNTTVDSTILNNSGELGCDSGTLTFYTTVNLNPGGTLTGTGRHIISGGSVAWHGTNTVQNSSLNFSGGTVTGSSNATIVAAGASLFDWSGGTLAGTVTLQNGSTLHLSGAGDRVLADSAVFNNAGTALFTGTGRLMANGYNDVATWNNLAGAHFNFVTDGSVLGHFNVNPIVFNNLAGARLAKTAGTNTTVDSTTLNNSGELGCDSGTLTYFTTVNLNPGGTFTGTGQQDLAGGTATLTGTNTVLSPVLSLTGANLVGGADAALAMAGGSLLDWSGGTLSGTLATLTGSTIRLSGTGNKVMADSAVLNNAGTMRFAGTGPLLANAYNAGATISNQPGGIIQVFTNATLGRINGQGCLLNNSGSIFLSNAPSLFQTDWNFVQSSSGTMGLVIAGAGAGTNYSRFAGSSVTLDGTLAVTLGGGFVPQTANFFDIVTYATRTGQFATKMLPPLPGGSQWQLTYLTGALELQVTSPAAFQTASLTNGIFQFTFTGQAGSSCFIEVSTNLFTWDPFLTNTPFNGTLIYAEPQTPQFPKRFYRATIFP